ncbi:hypothetical protein HANVADRAFT_3652 [Hanseniaspora valbyensis NRRL Y-1626]|uniref:C2H2-type domain-containing protein n=1 Tax=Hanseniaspora valbyensis NRRL Y-1626 TaxID=766949 RepID=A0A1B7T9X1_9ASCO|nr:hypothetical protein HANVADRAFT_3652 [Hanseniaspora valbyensis NRRL Y-1626]
MSQHSRVIEQSVIDRDTINSILEAQYQTQQILPEIPTGSENIYYRDMVNDNQISNNNNNNINNAQINNNNYTLNEQQAYQQEQLQVAQQYYMLQLQQQKQEYDQLHKINMPFSSYGATPANQMALESVREGKEVIFEKGVGADEGHIMVSAVDQNNNDIATIQINNNNLSVNESEDTDAGIGVYLSEVNGEFYLVDANGNPLFPSLNDDNKNDLDQSTKLRGSDEYDDEDGDDEKELRMLLINLMNTAAENEKVEHYLNNNYSNQFKYLIDKDQDMESGQYSTFDKLNLNQHHTSRVRAEQLQQEQDNATLRIKELLKSNPALQVNPKTKIELEKLPEHLKQKILKDKREREIDAKYIEISEKHNFNPVQLRILQSHLTSYHASAINRNAVSVLNQYNNSPSRNIAPYKKFSKDKSKKSKYKSILKKFQLSTSDEEISLEEETAKIQKNITQLNKMIASTQSSFMEQVKFYEDIINANFTSEQLKQLYMQSQEQQQQTLIKSFIGVMEQQQMENPYLITSGRVNIEPLHQKLQESLMEEQMKQQDMIKEQQQNLLNLQAMYESGQRFLAKEDQTENIMDLLNKQQRSKKITLDESAPASFHVYKSYKSKMPNNNKNLSPSLSHSSETSSNIANNSIFNFEKKSTDINRSSSRMSISSNKVSSNKLTPGTSLPVDSPMFLEPATTPMDQINEFSSTNTTPSITGSPSVNTGPKIRGRKPTKKSDSTYTCPYCSSIDTNFETFDLKKLKPDSGNSVLVNDTGKKTSFNRKDHLVRHINSVHMKIKPYMCEKCGKKFARTDNMKHHVAGCKQ